MKTYSRENSTKLLAGVGIMSALAIIVSFATSFIKIGFLSLDAGDIVIVLAAFIFGPVWGIVISLVSSLISMLYSGTAFWGMLMDFFSSAVFSFTASFVYSRKKSFPYAVAGIYTSVVAVSALMMPLNLLITPLYTGMTSTDILEWIPRLLLPFNFLKALFNGGAALLIYKPLVRALRAAKLITVADDKIEYKPEANGKMNTVLSTTLGAVSVAVAVGCLIWLAYLN